MAGYLIINISEVYLIALANSALYRAESETIKNRFIFLLAILDFMPQKKTLNTYNLAYIGFEISTLKLTRIR